MDLLLNAVVLGVLLGCFYAAVSLGLSVSFGLLDVPHVAHPAFLVMASYAVFFLNDRYEIDPLGGSRVVHNELTYGYRFGDRTVEGFYDTGALWQSDRAATLRHSVGVGYKQGIFVLSMAFPIRNGRIEAVFMAGMNY